MFLGKSRSVSELVLMTLGLVLVLMIVFGFVHAGGFSWSALFTDPKTVSQNESAYIDAIGSIAIGFAGAWVAIKIALVATNLQEQDSRNKSKEMHQKEADQVSTLNSGLTRNVLEAKRSCTSFIVFLEANPTLTLTAGKHKTYNAIGDVNDEKVEKLLNGFYARLEKDLLKLINSIEELVMDKTYIGIVSSAKVEGSPSARHYKLDDYFKATNPAKRKEIIECFSDIILKDSERYDFYNEYMENQNNFGDGLHYIRSQSLLEVRNGYIKDLLSKVNKDELTPSKAAWVLLGSLLFGHKKSEKLTYNSGFLFIALLLGSEIDDDLFKAYLTLSLTKESTKAEKELIDEVSRSVFFIHGEDEKSPNIRPASMLVELSELLKETKLDLYSLLLIPGENKGNSLNKIISDSKEETGSKGAGTGKNQKVSNSSSSSQNTPERKEGRKDT